MLDNIKSSIQNIISVYHLSTQAEKTEGKYWYDNVLRVADAVAIAYNCELEAVVGVIAALSPNMRWATNIQAAEDMVIAYYYGVERETIRVAAYPANADKAWAILNGAPPLGVLGGNKVRAFYACILGNYDTVCIDAHAYSVWCNQRTTTHGAGRISNRLYQQISADYVTAAAMLEIEPRVLQATTWLTWRRLHGLQ